MEIGWSAGVSGAVTPSYLERVTGELVPRPETRVSDAERNRVADLLHRAVGEGRLTLTEFEDRVGAVWAARTYAELESVTADLPTPAVPQTLDLRSRSSPLKRTGRWVVPSKVSVEARASGVKLDLTEAVITSPTVEVSLAVKSSSVTVVLPPGASASLDQLELASSSTKTRVPESGGLHVVIRGYAKSSTVKVRYQRRFWRWRW